MSSFTEVLPARKSSKHSAMSWVPNDTDVPDDRIPVAGTLTIDTDRTRVVYVVTEFPVPWAGRGFYLEKMSVTGDPNETNYSVFCSSHGAEADSCECKGAVRFGTCKHRDALRALLANGWI